MDYIDQVLEKLREWVDKAIDALFGPQPEREHEPIPIPIDDHNRRR